MKFFAYHSFDPTQSNSTFGFGGDLDTWESELIKLTNRGSAPRKGGINALDDWTRYKNNILHMQKIESRDPALYLALMGRPAPELDITRNPEYDRDDAVPHVKPKPRGSGTRGRVPGRPLGNDQAAEKEDQEEPNNSDRRGRRPALKKTVERSLGALVRRLGLRLSPRL